MNKELAQRELERRNGLPHLYSFPWYKWAYEFFESTNKMNLLCAANQISKSSTQIRKCIHWATATEEWGRLWPNSRSKPNQFWYLYPSRPVLEAEFATKWKQFLPSGKMKEDPRYGWKEIKARGELVGIEFNVGVFLYFKFYSQKPSDLQSGSVYAIFCDEELPMHLFAELINRTNATDGYFHMVFTATLGQDYWRRALEPGEHETEEMKGAWKKQVSLYDSQVYLDGTASQWTNERIEQVVAHCESHNEVQRRVWGRFVLASGRKYHAFDATKHVTKAHPIPKNWIVYSSADPGSGGMGEGHPAALCYVAVRPDYKQARVIACWRGDGIETENAFVVKKHIEIKEEKKLFPVEQRYDWASKDFEIVARGLGETFIPAEKSHEKGVPIVNTLFAHDMLALYDGDPEIAKLAGELSSLRKTENKKHAKDNLADALRYCVVTIPWDFSGIEIDPELIVKKREEKLSPMQQQVKERREMMNEKTEEEWPDPEEDFEEVNELAGGF